MYRGPCKYSYFLGQTHLNIDTMVYSPVTLLLKLQLGLRILVICQRGRILCCKSKKKV